MNGIAVTASMTMSDGHAAEIRKWRSVTIERDKPPRDAEACLCWAEGVTECDLRGREAREWLGIAGLRHDRLLASFHLGHDIGDRIIRRDQGRQAVRDRRDDRQ